MEKDNLLNNLSPTYRLDKWLNEIYKVAGGDLDIVKALISDAVAQLDFSTATWGIVAWEKALKIKTDLNLSIDDRRSAVQAKWKSDQKSDLRLLQTVCNSWKNGDVEVNFVNGKIQLTFIGEYGVPTDLNSLYSAIDQAKPAHLAVSYIFAYLLIKDIHNIKTINEMQTLKISEFAGRSE